MTTDCSVIKASPNQALVYTIQHHQTEPFGGSKSRTKSGVSLSLSPALLPTLRKPKGTIRRGHHLEKIVAGNEPAVSGGLGSQVITHNDDDAM